MAQSNVSHLALVYADAFFNIAKEKNIIEQIEEEFSQFIDIFNEREQFQLFLNAPKISLSKKLNFVTKFSEYGFSQIFINFLSVVLKKNRQFYFQDIYDNFEKFVDVEKERLRIKMITAFPIDEDTKQHIIDVLKEKTSKKVILEPLVNENIIGGIVLMIDDIHVDGSIRRDLRDIERHLKSIKIDAKLLSYLIQQ